MRVYLDHNATSPLRPEVRELFDEVRAEGPGNASSLHAAGRRARHRIDEARERIAAALGVGEDELVFTSGGTEANNLALRGACSAGRGLVTLKTEHSSVLEPAAELERAGHPLCLVGVDGEGRPDVDELLEAVGRVDAGLVSIQAANSEVGAVPDLGALGARLGEWPLEQRPLLHVDAVQALGRIPVEIGAWGADLASFSAHKLGGPLGLGVLVRRKGVTLQPLCHGGGQEGALRPGTENVPAIAAAALAIERAVAERQAFAKRTRELIGVLWEGLRTLDIAPALVGPSLDDERRLPNTLNVRFPDTDGKVLVTRLDVEGLEVSAGSACASGSLEASHVLLALGLDEDAARSGLRMSLGWNTTVQDCNHAVDILRKIFSRRAQGASAAGPCAQPPKRLHKSR